ncbi:MAG: sigma-70 family RNA polymerase sigma factor [Streptosporangiaceae bacterium]
MAAVPSQPAQPTQPAATRATDVSGRADGELLHIVHTLPVKSRRRAAACEALVLRYKSLVRSCARRYRDSPEPEEELMQVGYVGLLKAINNFDPAFGGNLAAYAQPCISGEIKRHFRDKRWQVHVKRPVQELLLEVRQARGTLTQDLGHSPNTDELARHLRVSTDDIRDADQADLIFHPHSLDAPVGTDAEAATLGELLGGDDPRVEHTLDMQAVTTHWNELPEREQHILAMRFYGNMTQAEIGRRLGVSQMHVSRLLARALAYLRECLLGADHRVSYGHQ